LRCFLSCTSCLNCFFGLWRTAKISPAAHMPKVRAGTSLEVSLSQDLVTRTPHAKFFSLCSRACVGLGMVEIGRMSENRPKIDQKSTKLTKNRQKSCRPKETDSAKNFECTSERPTKV